MKNCELCDSEVKSMAKPGHEPNLCGHCALKEKVCPWCRQKYAEGISYQVDNFRKPNQVIRYDLPPMVSLWCNTCVEDVAIDEDGTIL